jgi:hypothetical protein
MNQLKAKATTNEKNVIITTKDKTGALKIYYNGK